MWYYISGIIFFLRYLNDFSCFSLKMYIHNLLDMFRRGKKMAILKGAVDSFSYFSLISVILFSNQDHLCIIQEIKYLLLWCDWFICVHMHWKIRIWYCYTGCYNVGQNGINLAFLLIKSKIIHFSSHIYLVFWKDLFCYSVLQNL